MKMSFKLFLFKLFLGMAVFGFTCPQVYAFGPSDAVSEISQLSFLKKKPEGKVIENWMTRVSEIDELFTARQLSEVIFYLGKLRLNGVDFKISHEFINIWEEFAL